MQPTASDDNVLLTFKEAMTYLRVSRSTVFRLMHANKLQGHKVGVNWRFWKKDIESCIERQTVLSHTTCQDELS